MTGVVRDRSTTRLLKVSSVTSMTAVPVPSAVPVWAVCCCALSGLLPCAKVDGTVNRKIPRLHGSILPYACRILTGMPAHFAGRRHRP